MIFIVLVFTSFINLRIGLRDESGAADECDAGAKPSLFGPTSLEKLFPLNIIFFCRAISHLFLSVVCVIVEAVVGIFIVLPLC